MKLFCPTGKWEKKKFLGHQVGGSNEKKKKTTTKGAGGWMGYCPSAYAGSRYRELYRDTRLRRLAWARDTAGLERSRMLRHYQGRPRHSLLRVRAGPGWMVESRYKYCIVAGGDLLGRATACTGRCVTIQTTVS